MTRFVDVPALWRLVSEVGAAPLIEQMAEAIHEDYLRWPD
jgi:ornithine cyclodeaminase